MREESGKITMPRSLSFFVGTLLYSYLQVHTDRETISIVQFMYTYDWTQLGFVLSLALQSNVVLVYMLVCVDHVAIVDIKPVQGV